MVKSETSTRYSSRALASPPDQADDQLAISAFRPLRLNWTLRSPTAFQADQRAAAMIAAANRDRHRREGENRSRKRQSCPRRPHSRHRWLRPRTLTEAFNTGKSARRWRRQMIKSPPDVVCFNARISVDVSNQQITHSICKQTCSLDDYCSFARRSTIRPSKQCVCEMPQPRSQ